MDLRSNQVTMTVADYCDLHNRGDAAVDPRYQRKPGLWARRAQAYLIETMLRGFPIPKLALYQETDLKSRKTIKFVVDGQQRTQAILAYYNDALSLPSTAEPVEARGKRLTQLPDELQREFLAYPLQFDQFEGVNEDEVREFFRRINSHTTTLNAEESRNAQFQGDMKWFIVDLVDHHSDSLLLLDTLNRRDVLRMRDHKLIAEVVHAMLNGVTTTSKTKLDRMYRDFELQPVPRVQEIDRAVQAAFNRLLSWENLHNAGLAQRQHMVYSLLLALVAVEFQWDTLKEAVGEAFGSPVHEDAERNLVLITEAIEIEDAYYRPFIKASSEKTNTWDHRQTRIGVMAKALTNLL
ncbi:MAG: DUF262 domain-containing protein [Chloroflexi bacterium]|nr:DUF262 domain-containing protein [Chloroflexota bacterium]